MAVRSTGAPAARDLARVLVELDVLERQAARLGLGGAGAAQDRADAGDELLEAERLGHVVVAAERQAADLVLGRVARGEEDDRHAAALGAEPLGDLEALHVGQHDVEHDQVRAEARARPRAPRAPVPADSTSKPWKRSAIVTTSTMFGSSSTTRTRCWAAVVAHALSVGRSRWEFPWEIPERFLRTPGLVFQVALSGRPGWPPAWRTFVAAATDGHLFWITSRAAGILALLLSSAAVSIGLMMGGRLSAGAAPDLRVTHEALALATMARSSCMPGRCSATRSCRPSVLDLTRAVRQLLPPHRGRRSGSSAGWLTLLLGLSYYARARIGVQRWRRLHRFTALVWVLSIAHALGEGTDAGQAWFLLGVGALVVPRSCLLAVSHQHPRHERGFRHDPSPSASPSAAAPRCRGSAGRWSPSRSACSSRCSRRSTSRWPSGRRPGARRRRERVHDRLLQPRRRASSADTATAARRRGHRRGLERPAAGHHGSVVTEAQRVVRLLRLDVRGARGRRARGTRAVAVARPSLPADWHERFTRFEPASELSRLNADPRARCR